MPRVDFKEMKRRHQEYLETFEATGGYKQVSDKTARAYDDVLDEMRSIMSGLGSGLGGLHSFYRECRGKEAMTKKDDIERVAALMPKLLAAYKKVLKEAEA